MQDVGIIISIKEDRGAREIMVENMDVDNLHIVVNQGSYHWEILAMAKNAVDKQVSIQINNANSNPKVIKMPISDQILGKFISSGVKVGQNTGRETEVGDLTYSFRTSSKREINIIGLASIGVVRER